jgi:hypothetical protein
MTLFVHKQTGELHPDTQALFIKVADKIEKNGITASRKPFCCIETNHCGVARKITGALWRQQCG